MLAPSIVDAITRGIGRAAPPRRAVTRRNSSPTGAAVRCTRIRWTTGGSSIVAMNRGRPTKLLRFGFVAERFEERRLLLARHDVDAVPAADFFAELAADAGLLVDGDLAEVLGAVFR